MHEQELIDTLGLPDYVLSQVSRFRAYALFSGFGGLFLGLLLH